MYEEEQGVDFDGLMHFVETISRDGVSGADTPTSLFSARVNQGIASLEKDHPMHAKTVRFAEKMKKFKQGKYREAFFMETISTSDFGQLTTNLLSWRLLSLYTQAENVWEPLVDVNDTIPDFRNIQVTRMQGLDGPMSQVLELANYPMDQPSAANRQYKLAKYGRIFSMSWEAKLNDWLRMFDKVPAALAQAARNTENNFVTSLLASATGPNPSLFSTDGTTNGTLAGVNGGIAVNGPVNKVTGATNGTLNATNLKAIYTAMSSQKMLNGLPITVKPRYLVVPPSLLMTAQELLSSQFMVASNITTTGTTAALVPNVNVLTNKSLEIIENRWLALNDTSGNVNVTWYLLGDASAGAAAIEVGFLMGHRQPELFRQAPNAENVTGGTVNPEDGDFENDAMRWKARHVMGGIDIEPLYAYAAVGA